MYKKLVIFIVFIFFVSAIRAQSTPVTAEVLAKAYARANKENKNVIVIFHASWCVWCRKMDTSLADPAIKKYFENNYVITHITVQESKGKENLENPGGAAFMEEMGGKEQGLPYWVVLDNKGKKLADSQMKPGENTGCPANAEETTYFGEVLKKTSSLNDVEISAIKTRFRKNESH